MTRASRSGFAKREKERARVEKRQMKLARRQKDKSADQVTVDEVAETIGPDDAPE